MIPALTWFEEDLAICAPNIIGSILFLASGYLAFIETCHGYWGGQIRLKIAIVPFATDFQPRAEMVARGVL